MRPERIEEFAPGALATPVPMPDPARYQAPPGSWQVGVHRDRAQGEARARYEQDWYAAQAAESRRQSQLAAYRQQYDQWARAPWPTSGSTTPG